MCATPRRRFWSPPRIGQAAALFAIIAAVAGNGNLCAQSGSARETQVFGVSGRGTSFVYVFDRSLSMKGAALVAAKRELLASIGQLEPVHQFQIVFYNENPKMMQPPQMTFAGKAGLQQAESFLTGITASGGTDHVQALKLALKMSPDVIFFLTDADEPQLSPSDLKEIQRRNGGAIINAIELQSGPERGSERALRTLAEQNRGQYKYIDVTKLPRAE
jgi:hypothetical protein